MTDNTTLESTLAALEQDIEATQRAISSVSRAAKALRKVVQEGDLRKLPSTMIAVSQAVQTLDQQFANAKDNWSFNDEEYLGNGSFAKELIKVAARLGVKMYELDDRLYCYPSLIRILPSDQSVTIDKVKDRRLRPSVLAERLKKNQERPARFKPEVFLDCLYQAYQQINPPQKGSLVRIGKVIRLSQVYELLTLLPGQSREYTRAEFARDIYLLDRSGLTKTRDGAVVSFPSSTGTKTPTATMVMITEAGQEKKYYGISFSNPD